MSKSLDKYYALYIKTNPERKAKIDEMYETYSNSLPKPKAFVNWRLPILDEWFAAETDAVRLHVKAERYKEMGLDVNGNPLPDGDITTVDQPMQNTAEEAAEASRLEKAKIQQEYVFRRPQKYVTLIIIVF